MIRLTDIPEEYSPSKRYTLVYYLGDKDRRYWVESKRVHLLAQTVEEMNSSLVMYGEGIKVWDLASGPDCSDRAPRPSTYRYLKYLCLEHK